VVVNWTAEGEVIVLEVLTGTLQVLQTLTVDLQGTQSFPLDSSQGKTVIFRLTAKRGELSDSQQIAVEVKCAVAWFFTPEPVDGCPNQPAQFTPMVYQRFERGFAVYESLYNRIYIMANEGLRVATYSNTWVPGVAIPALTPPAGFQVPTAQIGYVWATNPWIDGRSLVQVLGYAVGAPVNYQGTLQAGNQPNQYYVRFPDLSVYSLQLSGTGQWQPVGRAVQ